MFALEEPRQWRLLVHTPEDMEHGAVDECVFGMGAEVVALHLFHSGGHYEPVFDVAPEAGAAAALEIDAEPGIVVEDEETPWT